MSIPRTTCFRRLASEVVEDEDAIGWSLIICLLSSQGHHSILVSLPLFILATGQSLSLVKPFPNTVFSWHSNLYPF